MHLTFFVITLPVLPAEARKWTPVKWRCLGFAKSSEKMRYIGTE